MPTKKGPARIYKLPRLLENSSDLIAIVNDQFEVVFANASCCQWLSAEPEEVVGKQLTYSSPSGQPEDRFHGICPSPTLFEQNQLYQSGQIRSVRDGKQVVKEALFVRLQTEQDDRAAVLVMASNHAPRLAQSSQNPLSWHSILAGLLQSERLIFNLKSLVGSSDRIRRIRKQVSAAAESKADCLVIGPPGSGREHIARTIFTERKIPNAQLVPIHCAIADSESIQNSIKNWVFERRSNDSSDWLLLLDVDRLGVDAQSELLGYTRIPEFQMPMIATASNDLIELAQAGQFSESLALHLSVQTIVLDALSERTEDIPLLAQAFIEDLNRSSSNQVAQISEQVIATFQEYHWPRNIAELRQYLVSAHSKCSGSTIETEDLPAEFGYALSAYQIGYHELQPIQLSEFLERIEKELITRALSQCNNNKTKTSQLLGISRARLLRRTSALNIQLSVSGQDGLVDESEFKEAD